MHVPAPPHLLVEAAGDGRDGGEPPVPGQVLAVPPLLLLEPQEVLAGHPQAPLGLHVLPHLLLHLGAGRQRGGPLQDPQGELDLEGGGEGWGGSGEGLQMDAFSGP